MKTTTNNPAGRLATTICIALLFGTGIWAQPNPDYQAYLADESAVRNESLTTQSARSDKLSESTPKGESQSNRDLSTISINTLFLDMRRQNDQGTGDLDSEMHRRSELIEKYGTEKGMDIFNGKLWIGMTSKMVYESIGEPCDVCIHTDDQGTHVHWAYWLYDVYLCFEDNILVSCSDY